MSVFHSFETWVLISSEWLVRLGWIWLLQSSAILFAGLLLGVLANRYGSAVQSLIYRSTLVATLFCPLVMTAWRQVDSHRPKPILSLFESSWRNDLISNQNSPGFENLSATPGLRDTDPLASSPSPAPESIEPFRSQVEMNSAMTIASPSDDRDASVASPTADPSSLVTMNQSSPAIPGGNGSDRWSRPQQWNLILAAFWIMGTTWMLLRAANAHRHLRWALRRAIPASWDEQETCARLSEAMNVPSPILVRSPVFDSPFLAGFWTPIIHLSDEELSADDLREILLHELAHLKRRDGLWRTLAHVAMSVLFFQPLLRTLARRLDATAEEVCDDHAIERGAQRRDYAERLVDLATRTKLPQTAAVGMASPKSLLYRRVQRVMDEGRVLTLRAGGSIRGIVCASAALIAITTGLLLTPLPSASGQSDESDVGMAANRDDAPSVDDSEAPLIPVVADADLLNTPRSSSARPSSREEIPPPIRGIVLGENGPVAGAEVHWWRSRVHDFNAMKPVRAVTDAEGRFTLVRPAVDTSAPGTWDFREEMLVRANGHGFDLTSPPSFQRNPQQPSLAGFIANVVTDGRQPFAVPPQGRPIRGRLIDIDGQPISGARIRIRYCVENRDNHARPPANEEERVLRRREKLNQLDVIEHVPIRFAAPSVTSNEDGRFEMIEIPDNHLFQLLVEGDNVASTDLMVRNFGDEMITVPPPRHTPAAPDTLLYPADFEAVIGPSVPIRGVVSDLDSGAPIANAVVRATDVHGERVRSSRERQHFATRTDEQGRYEITGMPIGSGNRLVAFTDGQLPYIPVGFNADTSTGSDSVQLDTKMRRGLWASGRVFDAETKEPFQGEVSYFSFLTDSVDEQYPGSKWAFLDGRYFTNANGEFKLPVMRAPGVIAFSTGNRSPGLMAKFPRGLGTHELEQFRDPKDGYYRTAPHYLHPGNFNRVALVDPGIDEDDVVVDLPLESSPPIKVSILGPSGEPYEPEVEFYGGNERYGWYATRRRPLVIEDLLPHQSRKAFAFDRNRQLIGGIIVRHGQEAPFELRMQKAGSVRGRLLDKDGSPIVDAHITVDYGKFQEDDVTGMWAAVKGQSANPTQIQVDEQGRFSIVGLSPDWIYSAHADHRRMGFTRVFGDVFKDLKIKPGESRDLGDVVLDDG